MDREKLKQIAAHRAVEHVQSNMVLGLGTGSTVKYALQKIAEKLHNGELKNIIGIPSSLQTERLANELKIPLSNFTHHHTLDLTIDGADEVDEQLNLIKGGGGALLREKILAENSDFNIIIVDNSKLSRQLGEKWAVPIEVIPFAVGVIEKILNQIGGTPVLRKNDDGSDYLTDQGNFILDTDFDIISDPAKLARELKSHAGIVEHGLFINLAHLVIAATENGVKEFSVSTPPKSAPVNYGQHPKLA
jgi:ribose 5-phosphate isomerase A